jgi:excisionase family DNA binding protein
MVQSNYIRRKQSELIDLMEASPDRDYITVEDAAKFLGMDKQAFRELAAQGHIPFAIGGILQRSKYTKIPKLPFFNWCLQSGSAIMDSIEIAAAMTP